MWTVENATKTLVWTKNFLSVFKKQKTEVFENALVWTGPNAFSFENAYFFIRFRLPSTLIRSKTEVYVCENGGFRKRSLEWRFLKTEVQRLCVDG